MGHPLIILPIAILIVAGGAFFAWQSGLLSFDTQITSGQAPVQDSGETEELTQGEQETAVCPAVCVEMWSFNSVTNACTFVECGSGCGPDGVETFEIQAQCEANIAVEDESSGSYTVEEYKAKPTLCQTDADCKVQLITCNQCDCGRGVNVWIEDYACTADDRKNSCGFSCPPSKAVCEAGACKKVEI